ncbi:MAG: hypothetical protein JW717_04925 [Marinilabiliaceae bacterium]|nr:hypothetical protein [Marinilabiliaceae bacterium]
MKNIYLIIIILLFGCSKGKIDKSIVLKIDNLEISNYEINKNKGIIYQKKNSKAFYEKEMHAYLNNYYFICDAFEKKYDTITSINKRLYYSSRLMMVQKYGYLWKKTISPIVDDFIKLDAKKIEKREHVYYFDYILIKDLDTFYEKFDSITIDYSNFKIIKNKCNKYDFLETGYFSYQWPFIFIDGKSEYLYNLKVGEVSKIIKNANNNIILYLDHIETITLNENENKKFISELQIYIETKLDKEKEKEIQGIGKLNVMTENIDSFLDFYLNPKKNNKNNGKIIMEYYLNDNYRKISFFDFMEYITFSPFFDENINRAKLDKLIDQYFWDDYLDNEAQQLGLYKSDEFILDQRNFKNKVILQEYLKNEIWNRIDINSDAIQTYYSNNLSQFIKPKYVVGDILIFESKSDALKNTQLAMQFIENKQLSNPNKNNIIDDSFVFKQDFYFELEDSNLTQRIKTGIEKMPNNTLYPKPISLHGGFGLFYKKRDEGEIQISLNQSYKQIHEKLKNEIFLREKDSLNVLLKNKYKIAVNKTGYEL